MEGADEEQSAGGAVESAMAVGNSIEGAMMAGLEKEFEPRGDLPTIQEILEVKDLVNHVQNLKQVYTQTGLKEVYETVAKMSAPKPNQAAGGGEYDKATLAKIENDLAVTMIKLMSQGKLGSPHSVKIDEKNGTLLFEDDEVEYSLIDRERNALAKKSEFIQMAKCLGDIEKQNLRLVEVLGQVHHTSRDIKLSSEFASVKIGKALGRGAEATGAFPGAFMSDDIN